VVVKEPLQYGVGRLQLEVETLPVTTLLKDSKNNSVLVSTATLPLTGVIVGGQYPVGFDFCPTGEPDNVNARFIYDRVVSSNQSLTTLVLKSYDGEKIPIALEFENKTGNLFYGKDCVIYPDTKFYLLAELDPTGMGTGDYAGRVFTQDYTTEIGMKITSLAKAYCCMPDLLSPQLEIGMQVQTQWIQSTTTTVKL
jgi:hypothetical protein